MNRSEALALVTSQLRNRNLVKHVLATEAVMRAMARRFGEDEESWGLAGLLHDLDYDATVKEPARHGQVTGEMLAGRQVAPAVLEAIRAHARGDGTTRMDQALYAADQLTGLIVASALIHPTKKLAAIDADFVVHRFAEKRFAPGANREAIASSAALGLGLEEFAALGLEAMRAVSEELGL